VDRYIFLLSNGTSFVNFDAINIKKVAAVFRWNIASLTEGLTILHKISPPLIVCRICSINSIRNPDMVLQIIGLRTAKPSL
jgi:hypothetical protein